MHVPCLFYHQQTHPAVLITVNIVQELGTGLVNVLLPFLILVLLIFNGAWFIMYKCVPIKFTHALCCPCVLNFASQTTSEILSGDFHHEHGFEVAPSTFWPCPDACQLLFIFLITWVVMETYSLDNIYYQLSNLCDMYALCIKFI